MVCPKFAYCVKTLHRLVIQSVVISDQIVPCFCLFFCNFSGKFEKVGGKAEGGSLTPNSRVTPDMGAGACLMLGFGTCLLLEGTSVAAVAKGSRRALEVNHTDVNTELTAVEAALQEIANSPPSAPRFAAQMGVVEHEQQWGEDCVDYPGADHS